MLARSIIYQQLATRAAATIYGRVRALSPGPRFPTSEQMLTFSDGRLRAAGLSRNKTRAVRDLADKIVSGELRLRGIARCDDEEIIRRLTTVWGIGEWTAQMFLIFKLGGSTSCLRVIWVCRRAFGFWMAWMAARPRRRCSIGPRLGGRSAASLRGSCGGSRTPNEDHPRAGSIDHDSARRFPRRETPRGSGLVGRARHPEGCRRRCLGRRVPPR